MHPDLYLLEDYIKWSKQNAAEYLFDHDGNVVELREHVLKIFPLNALCITPTDFSFHLYGHFNIYSSPRFQTTIEPGEIKVVYTDLIIGVPEGYMGKFIADPFLEYEVYAPMISSRQDAAPIVITVTNTTESLLTIHRCQHIMNLVLVKVIDNVSVEIVSNINEL